MLWRAWVNDGGCEEGDIPCKPSTITISSSFRYPGLQSIYSGDGACLDPERRATTVCSPMVCSRSEACEV